MDRMIWHRILDFNDRHFPDWRNTLPIFLSNAMAGEVGEVCSVIKRLYGGGTNNAQKPPVTKEEVAEEVFDVLVYGILLCEVLGVDYTAFESVVDKKMGELEKRMVANP